MTSIFSLALQVSIGVTSNTGPLSSTSSHTRGWDGRHSFKATTSRGGQSIAKRIANLLALHLLWQDHSCFGEVLEGV